MQKIKKIYKKVGTKIFSNSLWMICEKFISLFSVLIINALIAKYVGPEIFGKIAYASSIFVFVQTLAWFGTQNILHKRLSENIKSGLYLSYSTQYLRRLTVAFSSILVLIYFGLYESPIVLFFGFANALAAYFIISDYYAIYNNSVLSSRLNVLANVIGMLVALLVRAIIIHFNLDYIYLTIPIVLISLIPYFIKRKFFYQRNSKINLNLRSHYLYNKYIIYTGGALLLSTISVAVYNQISNIYLAKLVGFNELGVFNAAMLLGGSWVFVINAISISFFSKIYSEKNDKNIMHYMGILIVFTLGISICVLFLFFMFGEIVVNYLYGEKFKELNFIVPYIILAATLSCLGSITYRYMLKYNAYKYLMVKMLLLSLISIFTSYIFIKKNGVYGAVYNYILIEFLSLTIFNYFFHKGRVLRMHLSVFKINGG